MRLKDELDSFHFEKLNLVPNGWRFSFYVFNLNSKKHVSESNVDIFGIEK